MVVLAQEEARLLNHNYIGTEHILLGIVHEGEGVGAKALETLKISLESVRREVEKIIGLGSATAVPAHIPFTPQAKTLLEMSLREALELGHNYIGTEHILLGMIRESEGVAAQVLVKLGADLDRVRATVVQLLKAAPVIEQSPPRTWIARTFTAGGPSAGPIASCAICGRERWEIQRHVRAVRELICAECIERAHVALQTTTDPELMVPPLVEGEVPSDSDVDDIVHAYRTVFCGGLGRSELEGALEDGPAIAHLAEEAARRNPQSQTAPATFIVRRVRFRAVDDADVFYSIFGAPFAGQAIHVDSRWKVTRETWCHMLALGGVQCPPRAAE